MYLRDSHNSTRLFPRDITKEAQAALHTPREDELESSKFRLFPELWYFFAVPKLKIKAAKGHNILLVHCSTFMNFCLYTSRTSARWLIWQKIITLRGQKSHSGEYTPVNEREWRYTTFSEVKFSKTLIQNLTTMKRYIWFNFMQIKHLSKSIKSFLLFSSKNF